MSDYTKRKSKEEVISSLKGIALEMHNKMERGNAPTMTLPVRSKTNIAFDEKLEVYKYGKKKTVRDATSLGSARQLLRSLYVTEFIEQMRIIENGYYLNSVDVSPSLPSVNEPEEAIIVKNYIKNNPEQQELLKLVLG